MGFDAEVTNLTMARWLGTMHRLNACCTRVFVSGAQKLMICSMPFWVFHDGQWPASRLHARLLACHDAVRRRRKVVRDFAIGSWHVIVL